MMMVIFFKKKNFNNNDFIKKKLLKSYLQLIHFKETISSKHYLQFVSF